MRHASQARRPSPVLAPVVLAKVLQFIASLRSTRSKREEICVPDASGSMPGGRTGVRVGQARLRRGRGIPLLLNGVTALEINLERTLYSRLFPKRHHVFYFIRK